MFFCDGTWVRAEARMGLLFCRAEFFFALFCQLAELAIAFACAGCFQHAVIIVFRSAVAGHQRRSGNDGHKRKAKESIGVHHRSVRALSSGFRRYSANTNILGYFFNRYLAPVVIFCCSGNVE